MTVRTLANGTNFMAFEVTGISPAEVYRAIAGQTSCVLTRPTNYLETNNKNLGGVKDFFQGDQGWDATVEMDVADPSDVDAEEVSHEELDDFQTTGAKTGWFFCYVTPPATPQDDPVPDLTKPNWQGIGLVSAPLNSPAGDKQTASIAIQGCLGLTKTAGV